MSDPADDAAKASREAAQTQAGYQTDALNYLKQKEEIPNYYREQGLKGLGGLLGMGDGPSQQTQINDILQSPLYGALMSGKGAGEESILRNASMTGGLRSGGVQEALYDYNTQLQNQSLLNLYNQRVSGLQGMAGLSSYAPQIAQGTANIGETLAQGQVGAEQARQTGYQQNIDTGLGIGKLIMYSDRRLKSKIKYSGIKNGHKWYTWAWNAIAEKMGLSGDCQGCIADEVYVSNPESVILKDGFLMVLYSNLGIFPEVKNA
jgi:hypothetical protein